MDTKAALIFNVPAQVGHFRDFPSHSPSSNGTISNFPYLIKTPKYWETDLMPLANAIWRLFGVQGSSGTLESGAAFVSIANHGILFHEIVPSYLLWIPSLISPIHISFANILMSRWNIWAKQLGTIRIPFLRYNIWFSGAMFWPRAGLQIKGPFSSSPSSWTRHIPAKFAPPHPLSAPYGKYRKVYKPKVSSLPSPSPFPPHRYSNLGTKPSKYQLTPQV
jgi:hypothetical protein